MRIAVDLTALQAQPSGVDVSSLELVRHLARIDSANHYTLLINAEDRARFRRRDGGDKGWLGPNMKLQPCCVRSRLVRGLVQQCVLPLALARGAFDVVHSPSFLMPLRRGRAKHLLTVHDMTFFTLPQMHNRLRGSRLFRTFVLAAIRRANMINVPSQAVRDDLLEWMEDLPAERVRVTPWGIAPNFCPADSEDIARHARRLKLPLRYILYVGSIEPRKNLMALLDAFRSLVRSGDYPDHLVLAGNRGWNVDGVYRAARAEELRGRVHFAGYVSDRDLPWIYRAATAFVYPSWSEGFGFPPLEAMACGVPVIASRGSSLAENLNGAAELVAPSDPTALAQALELILKDAGRRQDLIRRGLERAGQFRWERTARLVLECYETLAGRAIIPLACN